MINKRKNTIVIMAPCFMILCSMVLYFVPFVRTGEAKAEKELNVLNLCDATDSLILLTELATESSKDCVQAKADHIEMLHKYVEHMKNRHESRTFVPMNNIAEKLKLVIKKLEKDGPEVDQQAEAIAKINIASKAIAEFLSKHGLFMDEPVVNSMPEAISEEIQIAIRDSLDEAHKKTKIYIDDLSMVNSEAAYRANRKAVVYLYLARFHFKWLEIFASEELRTFRGDINRTIYWNRVLKHSDLTKKERSRLTKCSINELRHLRLLHAIMDNYMREAHGWLKEAIKQAFPDVQFLTEK